VCVCVCLSACGCACACVNSWLGSPHFHICVLPRFLGIHQWGWCFALRGTKILLPTPPLSFLSSFKRNKKSPWIKLLRQDNRTDRKGVCVCPLSNLLRGQSENNFLPHFFHAYVRMLFGRSNTFFYPHTPGVINFISERCYWKATRPFPFIPVLLFFKNNCIPWKNTNCFLSPHFLFCLNYHTAHLRIGCINFKNLCAFEKNARVCVIFFFFRVCTTWTNKKVLHGGFLYPCVCVWRRIRDIQKIWYDTTKK